MRLGSIEGGKDSIQPIICVAAISEWEKVEWDSELANIKSNLI